MAEEFVSFHDHYIPSLEAGMYEVSIKSHIGLSDADLKIGAEKDTYFDEPVKRDFEVRSPQFFLSTTEIHSLFPPLSSVSEYSEVLPNIVMHTRTLPWERIVDQEAGTPWLHLIALKEGEVPFDEKGNALLKNMTVNEFLKQQDVLTPEIDSALVASDVLNANCNAIDVPTELFTSMLPSKTELPYLTHVREVDVSKQAHIECEDYGWFSVVVGNRFLHANQGEEFAKYSLHLISLEGVEAALKKGGKDTISLVSLFNWSCTSQSHEGKSFSELATHFVTQSEGDPDNLLLRKPLSQEERGEDHPAIEQLQMGYTPINYNLHTGEETFAWYRGPFTPVVAQDLPRENHYRYSSSDAALIYGENFGLFDCSYASAWTIGRLLALSNGAYSQALYRFRKTIHNAIGYLVDRIRENPELLKNLSRFKDQKYNSLDAFVGQLDNNIDSQVSNAVKQVAQPSKKKTEKVTKTANPDELLQALYDDENLLTYLDLEEIRHDQELIVHWLAGRQLLYDVPLNHFVPDPAFLPTESLRFFHIDQNWIDVLIDGALSIGIGSSKDSELNDILKQHLSPEIFEKAGKMRDELFDKIKQKTRKRGVCGLLINSSVVSGWPGLAIEGRIGKTPVNIVRMDHLTPNVLLCLFEAIPETVTLTEPQQSLCFGILTEKAMQCREITGDDIGKPMEGDSHFSVKDYITKQHTLSIDRFIAELSNKVSTKLLTPSEFAIQMVKAPERLTFKYQSGKK